MRTAIVIAALLSGCATDPGAFDNRVSCSEDHKKAYVVSMWRWFGIASEVSAADAEVICKQ